MKIYLMARYGRRLEMLAVAEELEALGHTVTSRWIRGAHELDDNLLNTDPEFRDREGARFAQDDLHDIWAAAWYIAFTEEPGPVAGRGRGGRHFEAGIAYANYLSYVPRPRLILVGPRENVFYCLTDWERFPDWASCRAALAEDAE